jgi:hypothetical protein
MCIRDRAIGQVFLFKGKSFGFTAAIKAVSFWFGLPLIPMGSTLSIKE